MIENHRTYRRFAALVLALAKGLRVAWRRRTRVPLGRPERSLANAPTLGAGKVVWLLVVALLSCSGSPDGDFDDGPVGKVAQALTDTDSDGMDDDWETLHFGNLSQTASGDFDSDGMTNGEEFLHNFDPTVDDSFDDADGDRYPNVFEVRGSADPNDAGSTPTPTYVVNGAGGGTHTTIGAALSSANVVNGAYQIIGIAPGVYTGTANLRDVTIAPSKPKLLFIGLEGAAKTAIEGDLTGYGWLIQNSTVISSLTFRKAVVAHYVESSAKEVRFVDLVIRDNIGPSWAAGIHVASAMKVSIVGSTFFDNVGAAAARQIWIGSGVGAIENTVVWSQSSGTMMAKDSGATLTTNHCLVKGQTLTGTGNLAGTTDALLRSDLRLFWNSPLRGAGGSVRQSRIDIDGELRPASAPDIGVDQFNDSDADDLADQWELDEAGSLTILTGRAQDADNDGLTNEEEYAASAKPTVSDTDGDGLSDGDEAHLHGTSPLKIDTDGDDMPDTWEVTYGLAPLVANGFEDADGDRYPNVFEYVNSTDPSDLNSIPASTYVVNGAGGGTHTTIGAAVNAANVQNGSYQIIGIAPGVYTGVANLRGVTIESSKPKLLLIGLEGPAKTVIEGDLTGYGWLLKSPTVVSSLTFRKAVVAIYAESSAKEVRFVDLVIRDNIGPLWAAGIHSNAERTTIVGSTFVDNAGASAAQQIWIDSGVGTIENTVVWGQSSGTMVAKGASAALHTNHCLVKGQTLAGTGNLAGTTDPLLRSDLHLLWDSPLRGAGGSVPDSRIDIDGELRPASTPDIGVDQFNDSDSDELADQWELDEAGSLTILTGRAQDADNDGLTNEEEYAAFAKPTVADTDGDGLSDGDEVHLHGTSPVKVDTDDDDMPDAWEVTYGLAPLIANRFEDADGDRYPNVFEYVNSTDPTDSQSTPAPTYVVNGAGGGTHTTISAAVNAANVQNGSYQVIGIAPGIYTGTPNLRGVTIESSKPKLLLVGLEGPAKTVIEGDLTGYGWLLKNPTVVSSLTFRKAVVAIYAESSAKEARFVDLIIRDNLGPSWAAGIHSNAEKTTIVGSTFVDNAGASAAQQIWIDSGVGTIENTVVWSQSSGTMVAKGASAALHTNHCLVKGQTLAGTGNLAGTTDPLLRSDLHLLWDSPLRGAGGSVPDSRIDIDGELRPASTPDIGVDQFNDSDSDELADQWELDEAGSLTILTGRAQDADNDGLTNEEEYAASAKPTVADTDGDGLSDGDEAHLHGTSPLKIDTDGDDMPDTWEVTYGLAPLVANGFEDADGDRYPNVFEYVNSTDPSDLNSIPASTYVVNGAGGGTHTTIGAAVNAANVQNGSYQIIGIAPGVYTGAANLRGVTIESSKPKLLLIGLEGPAKTVIEGDWTGYGWLLKNPTVVSSLTFRKAVVAIYAESSAKEARFVDLVIRDNIGPLWAAGIHSNAERTTIVGSTFVDNAGASAAQQIWIDSGVGTIENTVVWGQSSGTMVAKNSGATLTATHCLVKGQTLTGTGNLAGNTDPLFRSDSVHLRAGSPLRGAGGSVAQSRIDIDGELRPNNAPDIGVDQFNDSDSDGLPDSWEVLTAGNTSAIAGEFDEDQDGLSNAEEYDLESDWLNPDTDRDGVDDGLEIVLGTDPIVADADNLTADINGDGLIDSIGAQLGYQPNESDDDGDSISNADEILMCTDVVRGDSDGDGVSDSADAFPLDPLMSSLVLDPQDVDAPVITLVAPWYAVEQ